MGNTNILVVEDEQRLAELLNKQLLEAGFNCDVAVDGYIGKMMAESKKYNLIILDINIPLLNGYDLCRELRKIDNKTIVIMLTAFGTQENKMAGFNAGADDYVIKPFEFRELLARINVFLRRAELTDSNPDIIRISDLEMDLKTKKVVRGQKKIDLTVKESLLLETFLKNKGKLLTREFIMEQVWGIDFDPSTNIIDVYVNYLRKKIDKDFDPKLIHTKFGFGFYCDENEL